MAPEYSIEGRLPPAERVLLVGPRGKTRTTLVTERRDGEKGSEWIGALDVDGKQIKGKILFERDIAGEPFRSEQELLDFLNEQFSLSYLRDRSKPAIFGSG